MAVKNSPTRRRGFAWDEANSRLDIMVDSTVAARLNDTGSYLTIPAGGITVTAGGITITAGGLTVTAGGATVTAGDLTVTAGDAHVVAENLYMGAETAFATTEPTSAVVFKQGTAFAGSITTSGGIQSNGTVLRKIIADGTVSNIET